MQGARSQHRNGGPDNMAPVVIVGRGPTGMVTALQLAAMGVPSTVIDRQDAGEVEHGSKAVLIAGHVAEITAPLGVGEDILTEGLAWTTGRVFVRGKEVECRQVVTAPGLVPRVLNLTQQRVEELLLARVRREPMITLIPRTTVTSVDADEQNATVCYVTASGDARMERQLRARWLVGCDGARSTVRRSLGIKFSGYGHDDSFLIADIVADLPFPAERHLHFDPDYNPGRTVLIHPQPDSTWHIDWQVGHEVDAAAELAEGGLDRRIRQLTGSVPYEVRWVTSYRFKQLRAQQFRRGRVFLVGDAAHLTSPYGARGMNSGIADAENLGWRLAMVLRGWADERLLDGYCLEREHAADENLAVTGRTARFMCPRSRRDRLRQRAVLAAAYRFRPMGRYVDSGRLYEPPTYPTARDHPDCTDDSANPEGVQPGQLAPDWPLAAATLHAGRLREVLRGKVSVVWFANPAESYPRTLPAALRAGLPGDYPMQCLLIGATARSAAPLDPPTTHVDPDARDTHWLEVTDPGAQIYRSWNGTRAAPTGRFAIVRPDAYIAAVGRASDAPVPHLLGLIKHLLRGDVDPSGHAATADRSAHTPGTPLRHLGTSTDQPPTTRIGDRHD